METGSNSMSHQELLRGKEETLLRIIHPNVLLLALLTGHDYLDECTEQAIAAELTNFDRNRRLLDWVKQSPREAFDGFLRALRRTEQHHVANYIDGTPGDLPLCNEARKRLRRIKGDVIRFLDTSTKLLAYLYQEHVIGETDYCILRSELEMTNRNAMVMDIIMRGSERGFACFCDCLSSDVNQAYLVPCLQRGEILEIHVTTQPADKEKDIVTMLRKLMSMKEKLEELPSEEENHASNLLQQLMGVCIGARNTDSILLFTHLSTTEVLKSVHEKYDSGQLTIIIRDLFRCLAKDETLTVEVEISADEFKECEDGFADDGAFCISTSKSDSRACVLKNESDEMQPVGQKDESNLINRFADHLTAIGDEVASAADSQLDSTLTEVAETAPPSSSLNPRVDTMLQHVGNRLLASDSKFADFVDSPLPVDTKALTGDTDIGDDAMSVVPVDTGYYSDQASPQRPPCDHYVAVQSYLDSSSEMYSMTSTKRGMFIMISNEHFIHHRQRIGADYDVVMLRRVFTRLNFDVFIHRNITAMEAFDILVKACRKDHSQYDCFALAILTHGDEGNAFYGIDGKRFLLADLMAPIKKCRTLVGKPKICIVQASRGDQLDDGIDVNDAEDINVRIPLEADQLIVHSTTEGHHSWRNTEQGSWFIRALSHELLKSLLSPVSVDLTQVLTKVTRAVAYDFQSRAASSHLNSKKQVPSLYSTLTKEIQFPPPTEAITNAVD